MSIGLLWDDLKWEGLVLFRCQDQRWDHDTQIHRWWDGPHSLASRVDQWRLGKRNGLFWSPWQPHHQNMEHSWRLAQANHLECTYKHYLLAGGASSWQLGQLLGRQNDQSMETWRWLVGQNSNRTYRPSFQNHPHQQQCPRQLLVRQNDQALEYFRRNIDSKHNRPYRLDLLFGPFVKWRAS